MKPIVSYEGRDFFSEAELKQRVAELDLEHAGEPMPIEARKEWNKINAMLDEFKQTMKALKKFVEVSNQHTPYLMRKAQRIEEYLNQR